MCNYINKHSVLIDNDTVLITKVHFTQNMKTIFLLYVIRRYTNPEAPVHPCD
jgi:hypothetical protein